LGTYPNNHQLSSAEGDQLADFMLNGGRVYMEGGDTWAYDNQTAAHAMFHISGTDDGTGDLFEVTGMAGGFAANYDFVYDGTNSYIDHLTPNMEAVTLFSNIEVGYDVAIAYENEVYKSIGASFEFGGLVDSETSTKDGLMAEMLHFFSIPFVWTGIEDQKAASSELLVYPNPVDQTLNIEIKASVNGTSSITLLDMLGRRVMKTQNTFALKAGQNLTQLDVSQLNNGIYYVVISTPQDDLTQKIIINH
jgi:hypothetical protein